MFFTDTFLQFTCFQIDIFFFNYSPNSKLNSNAHAINGGDIPRTFHVIYAESFVSSSSSLSLGYFFRGRLHIAHAKHSNAKKTVSVAPSVDELLKSACRDGRSNQFHSCLYYKLKILKCFSFQIFNK